MKNYSPKTAAQQAVWSNVKHGLSRHTSPQMSESKVVSVLTEKAHVSALTMYSKWILNKYGRHLHKSTPTAANQYLKELAETKRQATVSLARQAINMHVHYDCQVAYVKSTVPTIPQNRAYTPSEILLLRHQANPALSLSVHLVAAAGLRGMELVSLAPMSARIVSQREWHVGLFKGREQEVRFSVHGKGGLLREVRFPVHLTNQLESTLRPNPLLISHRGAHLLSYYDLMGGHAFSCQFGQLSVQTFDFSFGAHGLRHAFAQRRRDELLWLGFSFIDAIKVLSQELGHFSSANTFAYLRDQSYDKLHDRKSAKSGRQYYAYSTRVLAPIEY